ncbi:MAG: YlbF family regulator [Clostridiales bacterium]|nr:YlbF family regulator [Clostridiales bacterium]
MSECVIEKARELADVIARSDEYTSMKQAENAAAADLDLESLYNDYQEKRQAVAELTKAETPDFDAVSALTREVDAIENQLRRNVRMRALNDSRAAFTVMMNAVNRELQKVLSPESVDDGCSSGSCASCRGCSVE